jgi:hypothetical protein
MGCDGAVIWPPTTNLHDEALIDQLGAALVDVWTLLALPCRPRDRETVIALAIYLNSQAVSLGFCGGAC